MTCRRKCIEYIKSNDLTLSLNFNTEQIFIHNPVLNEKCLIDSSVKMKHVMNLCNVSYSSLLDLLISLYKKFILPDSPIHEMYNLYMEFNKTFRPSYSNLVIELFKQCCFILINK